MCMHWFTCTFLFPSQQEMVKSGKIPVFAEPVEVVEEREGVREDGREDGRMEGREGRRKEDVQSALEMWGPPVHRDPCMWQSSAHKQILWL